MRKLRWTLAEERRVIQDNGVFAIEQAYLDPSFSLETLSTLPTSTLLNKNLGRLKLAVPAFEANVVALHALVTEIDRARKLVEMSRQLRTKLALIEGRSKKINAFW